jgi:dipeptidyl aminopeptidase/acylaminoacyl peptidase
MQTRTLWLAGLLFTGVTLAAPPPPEAYGRLPAIGDAALSPDGKRVAVVVGFEYRPAEPDRELSALRIINLESGKIEHTLAPPPRHTLRGVGWADDHRAYYFISAAGDWKDAARSSEPVVFRGPRVEFQQTGVFSLETGTTTMLMDSKAFRSNSSLTRLHAPVEGEPGFGRMMAWSGATNLGTSRLAVHRVNLDKGNSTPIESGNDDTVSFLLDERGDAIARLDRDDRSNRWKLLVKEDGKYRAIIDEVSEMGLTMSLHGLLQDGRIAAVDYREGGARDELYAIDRRTGEKSSLHKTDGSDIGTLFDPWTHRILGVRWTEDLPKEKYFDPQLQAIYEEVSPHFADGFVRLETWSRDRGRVLLLGERAGDAGAYYIYDTAARKMRSLGKRYPALGASETLGMRQAIRYKARDGVSVPAYLTLPAGVAPKKLPLVLLVHGGPHQRDNFTFDWWASFLASRGYAVLQPNFRGSGGYGFEWLDAGRGGWGDGLMQTDVEDGADALAKNGTVDASRVCIMGASYGGYSALAGLTVTPERYACGVSVNGLSDLQRVLDSAASGYSGKRSQSSEWWRKSIGDDRAHVRKISPIENTDRVRAPLLLIHGANDSRIPVEQSRDLDAKLKRAGKNVRYVELLGDDHWLSSAATRTQMLTEIEKFLAEHLAADGEAALKN